MATTEHVKKKPKLHRVSEPNDTSIIGLEPVSLSYYNLPFKVGIYQGSFQGNRIAVQVEDHVCSTYVAAGKAIQRVKIELNSDLNLERGKEGALVPNPAEISSTSELLGGELSCTSEVQNLLLYNNPDLSWSKEQDSNKSVDALLAAVDATGVASLIPLSRGTIGGDILRLQRPTDSIGESGWAGIALHGRGGGTQIDAAVARQFSRDVALYDIAAGGRIVRSWGTTHCPSALLFVPSPADVGASSGPAQCAAAKLDSEGQQADLAAAAGPSGRSLLAVAEEHQITLWDVRQAERGGLVAVVQAAPQGYPLWAMALCGAESGLLGCAGSERALTMLDLRKWRVHCKWQGCVKYPVTHVAFSRVNSRYAYVAGLDYECVGGRWDGSSGAGSGNSNSGLGNGHGGRAVGRLDEDKTGVSAPVIKTTTGLSFRGSSKWLGLAVAASSPPLSPSADEDSSADARVRDGLILSRQSPRDILVSLSLTGGLYVGQAVAANSDA